MNLFFAELKEFATTNAIPPFMAYNLDEEGHDEFVDAHNLKIIVKIDSKNKHRKFVYPVTRKPNHTTFLGCVNANGSFIKPMIVIKRKSVERTLMLQGYIPDRLILDQSNKGYMTTELFAQWLVQAFEPELLEIKSRHQYNGPGLIIADGCTVHKMELFEEVCRRLNLKIVWLPPQSSNQLQVLDLGVFAIHKSLVNKQDIALIRIEIRK